MVFNLCDFRGKGGDTLFWALLTLDSVLSKLIHQILKRSFVLQCPTSSYQLVLLNCLQVEKPEK